MLNKSILIGRLGKKPEMRYLQDGTAVCNFSLATSETWKDKSGERKEKTEWHKLIAFGRTAEICTEYLDKGSLIYAEGKIQTRQWEDKDGDKHQSTEIVISEMKMLGGKKESEPEKQIAQSHLDDDVPF